MPADANVFSQIRPFQAPDTVNQLAKVLQVQAMQDEAGVNRLKMQQVQQGMADQNRLRDLLSKDYANPQDRESALLKGGFVDQAGKLSKDRRESAKVEAETGKLNVEAVANRAKLYAPQWANVQSPQQAAQLVTQMHNDQAFAGTPMTAVPLETKLANIPADPAQFAQWRQQMSVGSEKFAELMAQRRGQDITMRGQDMSADTARRGQDITVRGQNMVDSRAREANQAGKVPAGYRMKADGNLEFIPGGPADPNAAKRAAPTEFQGKAGMFGNRAQAADQIITELTGKYSPAAINAKLAAGRAPVVGGAAEMVANGMLSPEAQRVEQAQRDFVNAVLRLESGAAIGQSEFDNAIRQYFPQPNDKPENIAQKAANRKRAIQGLIDNARPGGVQPAATPAGGAWKIEKVN